jgi:hypothetical protein
MRTRAQARWTAVLLAVALCLASAARGEGDTPPGRVDADRWLELDLYRFDRSVIDRSARAFWARFAPLFEGVSGTRGVILNIGWLADPVLLWEGDLDATIPAPDIVEPVSWGRVAPWTYADVARLVGELRQAAAERHGLPGVKVGLFVRGRALPGARPRFEVRHPEAFRLDPLGELLFDPGARLDADIQRYGAYPAGVPAGLTAGELFGAQWGSLSRAVGLDAIVLRDGMLLAGRDRLTAPDELAAAETRGGAVAELVRHTKEANPRALVMGSSSSASAIADWHVDGVDLEAIAREGHLDAFIDDARGSPGQLAHLLVRGAMLSGTPTRHYVLIEPFDSSASTGPSRDRLRWGAWASHHAAVRRPAGLEMPAGTYVSWGPGGAPALSETDVALLTETLDDAIHDARATREVYGPTLVYNRAASEWLMTSDPGREIGQWIDDVAGALMEWPVPILSAARLEDLPRLDLELPILQTPAQIGDREVAAILDRMAAGRPVAIFGSPAGGVDPAIAREAGLVSAEPGRGAARRQGTVLTPVPDVTDGLPAVFELYQPLAHNVAGATATVVHAVEGSPTLVLRLDEGRRTLVWDPPEPEAGHAGGGPPRAGVFPWVTVARALGLWLREGAGPWVEGIEPDQPFSLAAWRLDDGSRRVLVGNLGDPDRTGRRIEVSLPAAWLRAGGTGARDLWSEATFMPRGGRLPITVEPGQGRLLALD